MGTSIILNIIHSARNMQGLTAVALPPSAEAQEASAAQALGRHALLHRSCAAVRGRDGPRCLQAARTDAGYASFLNEKEAPFVLLHPLNSSCSCVDRSEKQMCNKAMAL